MSSLNKFILLNALAVSLCTAPAFSPIFAMDRGEELRPLCKRGSIEIPGLAQQQDQQSLTPKDIAEVERGKVYEKGLNDTLFSLRYPHQIGDKGRVQTMLDNALEIIPAYHQIDPAKALRLLDHIIEEQVKHWGLAFNPEAPNATSLRFLRCAQQLSPALFEKHSAAILSDSDKLAGIMAGVLKKEGSACTFEGSMLSTSNVIEKAFERLKKESDPEAFRRFLRLGTVFHEKYQDRIAEALPLYLKLQYADSEIISLLKSPTKRLRVAAFQVLTEYITKSAVSFSETHLLKEIFLCDLHGIIGDGRALDAYQYFYQACIKNDCVPTLQLLWSHLAKIDDTDVKIFLQATIKEFFNLPRAQSPTDSFDSLLNNALITALEEKCIPASRLRKFLMHANHTGLSEKINPLFLEEYKSFSLLQEGTPLSERAQFLNDLIANRLKEGKGYEDVALKIDSLSGSMFKEYAKTVIATLNPNQTFYEYFGNRKKLQTLHDKNKDLGHPLDVIRSLPLGYYNAFRPKIRETDDTSKLHVSIVQKLEGAELHGDMMFGYVANDTGSYRCDNYYRLYACDSTSGYAVWATPKLKEKCPVVVQKDVVYCVRETNDIAMYNKLDGSIIGVIVLPVPEKIKDINVTEDKILFALYGDNQLCIANLAANGCITCRLPQAVNTNMYRFIGDKIIFVTREEELKKSKLQIFDKNGSEQIFDLGSLSEDLYLFFPQLVQGNQDMVWYPDNNEKKVIFLDFATGRKLWEFQLSDELKEARLSKKADKLFLLTKRQLIALDMRTTPAKPPILLWQTSIYKGEPWHLSEITNIVVSDDDCIVYGIHDDFGGALFQFDSQTGAKHYLYDVGEARTHEMLGTHDGKLYIQPISF
jgi:hypothetical protein